MNPRNDGTDSPKQDNALDSRQPDETAAQESQHSQDFHEAHEPVVAHHRQKGGKRKLVLIIVALVVVAAAVVGALMYKQYADEDKAQGTSATQQETTAAQQESQAYTSTQKQSEELSNTGKYTEQIAVLQAYVDKYSGTVTKPTGKDVPTDGKTPYEHVMQAVFQLGAAYLNAGNYQNSIKYYKQGIDMSDTPERKLAAIHGMAMTYERMGDKANAIAQYKAAIEIAKTLPANTLSNRTTISDEQKITDLGGTL